ncbi:hypothetical protein B0H11DRAFT_2214282 [Mycena galericulata]|nr:hypothetical protein B0H11DRAFT_2214282 [Mycena galericulata]
MGSAALWSTQPPYARTHSARHHLSAQRTAPKSRLLPATPQQSRVLTAAIRILDARPARRFPSRPPNARFPVRGIKYLIPQMEEGREELGIPRRFSQASTPRMYLSTGEHKTPAADVDARGGGSRRKKAVHCSDSVQIALRPGAYCHPTCPNEDAGAVVISRSGSTPQCRLRFLNARIECGLRLGPSTNALHRDDALSFRSRPDAFAYVRLAQLLGRGRPSSMRSFEVGGRGCVVLLRNSVFGLGAVGHPLRRRSILATCSFQFQHYRSRDILGICRFPPFFFPYTVVFLVLAERRPPTSYFLHAGKERRVECWDFVLARGEFDAAVVFAVREHLLWYFLLACWTYAAEHLLARFIRRPNEAIPYDLPFCPRAPVFSVAHESFVFLSQRDERLSMSSEYQRDSPLPPFRSKAQGRA